MNGSERVPFQGRGLDFKLAHSVFVHLKLKSEKY